MQIANDDKKLIFIHIPRNAGTSICEALNISAEHYSYKRLRKSLPQIDVR